MKKKLFLSLIMFLICYPALFAQARFVIAVEGLKMRSEPDLSASSMGIIPYGTQVWQISALKEWKKP
jgi:capsule polysaccharide export protein KpsE/RkpR